MTPPGCRAALCVPHRSSRTPFRPRPFAEALLRTDWETRRQIELMMALSIRGGAEMGRRTLSEVGEPNIRWMAAVAELLCEKQQLIQSLDDDDPSPEARALLQADLLEIDTVLSWLDPD